MTEMVGLTCRVGAHNSRYAHDTLYTCYIQIEGSKLLVICLSTDIHHLVYG